MPDKIVKALYISYNGISEPIVQSQVIPYLRELSKRGIKFYLLTFEKKAIKEKNIYKIPGIEWFSLKYHKKPTIPATAFDVICGFFYSLYIISRNGINIVHARAVVAALIGYPVARLLSRKFIFDTRGIDSEEYVDAGLWKRNGVKHKIVSFLEGVLTRSSDHVIVLTEKFFEILKNKYHESGIKFSVIPCAADTEKFKPKRNESIRLSQAPAFKNKFIITYIGSVGTWYMLEEMIDFFKAARQCIDNAHLLLLIGKDRDYAKNMADKKGLGAQQFTIDSVSYDIIPDYLSSSNLGMFFIKPVFSKLSSSPVKFGEYLACGLPVVINSGIGDTEEIVRNDKVGVVINSFDKESYKNAILELKNLLKDTGLPARCRQAAEKYLSLNAAVDKYEGIYKSLSS